MTTANTKTQAESFTGNLFLIGFMGSGKSTIAAELSRMLHRPVLEMDEEIEKREGMSIPAIFSEHGEAYFRQLETDLLKETSALGGFLVSCGGGAAMREENVREMKKSGIIVLLTALPETILERVADDENRPLLKGRKNTADIEALIEKRRPAYEAAANYRVATDQKTSAETGVVSDTSVVWDCFFFFFCAFSVAAAVSVSRSFRLAVSRAAEDAASEKRSDTLPEVAVCFC